MCYTIYERQEAQLIAPTYYKIYREFVCDYVPHRETGFWCKGTALVQSRD
jgi:hypothetical protein